MIKEHLKNKYNESHITYCRYCKSRDITPVKIVSRFGPRTRTSFNCPVCGEELDVAWSKKEENKND